MLYLPYTIGFELEAFLIIDGKLVAASNHDAPHDDDKLLIEFRGTPSKNVYEAVYSVKARIAELHKALNDKNYQNKAIKVLFENWWKKDEEYDKLMRSIARKHNDYKQRIAWRNMYGLSPSQKNHTHHAAGLHISIKDERSFMGAGMTREFKYATPIDFPTIFRAIQTEFDKEVEESERGKGFYEMKADGRVEYRSLPNSVFMQENFADRLQNALFKEHD